MHSGTLSAPPADQAHLQTGELVWRACWRRAGGRASGLQRVVPFWPEIARLCGCTARFSSLFGFAEGSYQDALARESRACCITHPCEAVCHRLSATTVAAPHVAATSGAAGDPMGCGDSLAFGDGDPMGAATPQVVPHGLRATMGCNDDQVLRRVHRLWGPLEPPTAP